MDEMVNSGVNESVAAEPTQESTSTVHSNSDDNFFYDESDNVAEPSEDMTEPQQGQETTGVETKAVAEPNANVEKAFAARLKEATAKARQEARDAWIAEQGYEWKGKQIATEAEYRNAIKEKELEDTIRNQYSNVPDEIVNELMEGRRFRDELQAERKALQEKESQNKMMQEFINEYPEVKPTDIPSEVWESVSQGKPLTDAYAMYENKMLRQRVQALSANARNAETSTGAVKSTAKSNADQFLAGFDSIR